MTTPGRAPLEAQPLEPILQSILSKAIGTSVCKKLDASLLAHLTLRSLTAGPGRPRTPWIMAEPARRMLKMG